MDNTAAQASADFADTTGPRPSRFSATVGIWCPTTVLVLVWVCLFLPFFSGFLFLRVCVCVCGGVVVCVSHPPPRPPPSLLLELVDAMSHARGI